MVSEARKYEIKLVLSFVNNYENFGGKKQYVEWARNQGQSITSDDDFFTNSLVKQYYKNHVKVKSYSLIITLVFSFKYILYLLSCNICCLHHHVVLLICLLVRDSIEYIITCFLAKEKSCMINIFRLYLLRYINKPHD